MSGPIATKLAASVASEVQRQGMVIWLDKSGAFTSFVDELAIDPKRFTHPVIPFRGSFLEVLFALESHLSGLDKSPLLLHMPGFDKASIRKTPLLEFYEAGFCYTPAIETLFRESAVGRAEPQAIEAFLQAGSANAQPLTLDAADAWLTAQSANAGEGLSGILDQMGVSAVLEALIAAAGRKESLLARRVKTQPERDSVQSYLSRNTGLSPAWMEFIVGASAAATLDDLTTAAMGWLLCTEYVHDLNRAPTLPILQTIKALPSPLVKSCVELVTQLRTKHADTYVEFAEEIEPRIASELHTVSAEDLGKVDTFRTEETRMLEGGIAALNAGEWSKAASWAEERLTEKAFWPSRDQLRRWAWTLVAEAAELGRTLDAHQTPFKNCRTLDAAVQHYASEAFAVDRAHRRFEQRLVALLDLQLPHYFELKAIVKALHVHYRTWADEAARAFSKLCQDFGFLPDSSLQQRTLFEQVVQPLASQQEKVAYFVIDAFRFEMATELVKSLESTGSVVDLKARLAELPSITSVGMNALAPVSVNGRLQVAGQFRGFKAGEFTVSTPADRARAVGLKTVGQKSALLSLSDVCELEASELKRKMRDAAVVVVHSKEIDDAGEANLGPATFDLWLRSLRTAYVQLQKAGIKQFVFTADHGFLLLDPDTTQVAPFGTKRDPQRRYVIDEHARAEAGMVNVSFSALGYDGIEGYLLLREDTALFATGNAAATFVHGGNSPQERIIPVLTVTRQRAEGSSHVSYELEVKRERDLMGMRRISVRAKLSSHGQLSFVADKFVQLSLRAIDHPDARVVIKDVTSPGRNDGVSIAVPIGGESCEIIFTVDAVSEQAARVEVFGTSANVKATALADWFAVDWVKQPAPVKVVEAKAVEVKETKRVLDWADAIEDEKVRRVFVHIGEHGSITEAEMTQMLGSPRAFRRFSVEFEEHARKTPFLVRIETGADGKRYVRERDK